MLSLIKRLFVGKTLNELWIEAGRARLQGRQAESLAICRKVVSLRRRSALDHVHAGLAEYRLGNRVAAFDVFAEGLDRFPASAPLREQFLRVGIELGEIGRLGRRLGLAATTPDETCSALFRVAAMDDALRLALIRHCIDRDMRALAATELERLDGGNLQPERLWRIAQAYFALGQEARARARLRALAAVVPQGEQEIRAVTLARLRLGDVDGALESLECAIAQNPDATGLREFYLQQCGLHDRYARYAAFVAPSGTGGADAPGLRMAFHRAAIGAGSAVEVVTRYRDIEAHFAPAEFAPLQEAMLERLRARRIPAETAKFLLLHAHCLDLDRAFCRRLAELCREACAEGGAAADVGAIRMIDALTPPMMPQRDATPDGASRRFIEACRAWGATPGEPAPALDALPGEWAPWQCLFFFGRPDRYAEAMHAFGQVLRATWPEFSRVAPHVQRARAGSQPSGDRLRVGFIALDHMPMMSGLAAHLDRSAFEPVFLHPGPAGDFPTARDWRERVERRVEYPAHDVREAIERIAGEALDIIVCGPSVPSVFLPLVARLAPLQMVLLEPNWTNGLESTDYYLSWQPAEPAQPERFYANAVAYLEHPPYWIEKPASADRPPMTPAECDALRRRLTGVGEGSRIYLCASAPPKLHPAMDGVFAALLRRDPQAVLVILRGQDFRVSTFRSRLRAVLGKDYERVIFLPKLDASDAHGLLLAADCCLDSFPISGMSSSFDGAMLGVPLVTLPHDTPFGRWTAAIYDDLDVQGLTANSVEDYIDIAWKLATDPEWRAQKSSELKRKAVRYVESEASARVFEDFLLRAWQRHVSGQAPAHWIDGRWHDGARRPPS